VTAAIGFGKNPKPMNCCLSLATRISIFQFRKIQKNKLSKNIDIDLGQECCCRLLIFILRIIFEAPSGVPETHLFVAAHTGEEGIYSLLHIRSRKGLNGMNPSSSSGSQSSFIRFLASSLLSFSPRLVRRRNSW